MKIKLEKMSKHIKTLLETSKKYRLEKNKKKKKNLGDTWDKQYMIVTNGIYEIKEDSIGDRMKLYEKEFQSSEIGFVDSNKPIIVRLDGKAFHTWTKKTFKKPLYKTGETCFKKPFDEILSKAFQLATIKTCKEIQQTTFAYSQSDEVTFILSGWEKPDSQVYFDGKIQKIVSVIASVFTAHFNHIFEVFGIKKFAFFDARVFNVPNEIEVENIFICRQLDAKRNSIQALAQSLYSQKELNKKNQIEQIKMCLDKGAQWNELSSIQRWGFVVYKEMNDNIINWKTDIEIPYFIDDRNYLKNIWKNNDNS